ncbi:cupin domain-containing protein [Ancylobacter dichloromethanicus]
MQAGITTEFETTEFAGLDTRIVNSGESPFTVLDMTIKPGFGAPAHISPTEDKLFIVITGRVKYLVGEDLHVAEPGARIQVPKGVIHGFTNVGDADARHILISTPRRHEEFFSAHSTRSPSRASSIWTCCPKSPPAMIRRS